MKKHLEIACSKSNLGEIRAFIKDSLEAVNIENKTKGALILAIDEACANAIIHGNNNDASNVLEVGVDIADKKLIITISDIGGKDFSRLKHIERDIEDLVKAKSKGGMGLKLMHTIMDKVEYVEESGIHKCKMHKNLSN